MKNNQRKPVIVNVGKTKGYWTEVPHRRFLSCCISPFFRMSKKISMGLVVIPARREGGLHIHKRNVEELWYIISGKGKVQLGNKRKYNIKQGDIVYGPGGVSHQLINTGSRRLKALWILCPPGDEKRIVENTPIKGCKL